MKRFGDWAGFRISVDTFNNLNNRYLDVIKNESEYRTFFIAVPLILALLHFFLFIFNKEQKQNLFYVLFLIFFSLFIYVQHHNVFVMDKLASILIYRLAMPALVLTIYFGSLTAFSIYQKPPKYYFYLLFIGLAISGWWFFNPSYIGVILCYIYITIVSAIAGSILFRPLKIEHKSRGIIQTGFIIMGLCGIYQMFIVLEFVPVLFGLEDIWIYGVLAFTITMSIALAKDFADTSKNLKRQLIQVKELSEKTLEQERLARQKEIERRLLEADNERT